MPKQTFSHAALPAKEREALQKLGRDLRLARQRRGWSLRETARRLLVSVPTLRRLEAGHPGVSLGVLTQSLFLFGLSDRLAWLADPRFDMKALAEESRRHLTKRGERDGFDV